MMREILYKAKRVDNDQWVYGYYYPEFDDLSIAYILNKKDGIVYKVKSKTVCQFIGLKDNKNQNIFEYDKFDCDEDDFIDSYYLVEWNEEMCQFQVNLYSHRMHFNEGGGEEFTKDIVLCDEDCFDIYFLSEMEIIGNIN